MNTEDTSLPLLTKKMALILALLWSAAAAARMQHEHHSAPSAETSTHSGHESPGPHEQAPISVMGHRMHEAGGVMFSYRFMTMSMEGNQIGTSDVSPETIVTTVPNRFANPPMMPSTLRVVPTKMTMRMHMLGAMYAPSERITLMAMVPYLEKEMDHVTFQGAAGTTQLGTFTTETSGLEISMSVHSSRSVSRHLLRGMPPSVCHSRRGVPTNPIKF